MPAKGYSGITVRRSLARAAEQFIAEHPEPGYKNVADFTAETLRLRISESHPESDKSPL